MGYDSENIRRIRREYDGKYLKAREAAARRRDEVHLAVPEIAEIDREMGRIGLWAANAVFSGEQSGHELDDLRRKQEELKSRRRLLMTINGFDPDYTEIRYECPLCGDTGFVDCKMCSCMKKKLMDAEMESSGLARLLRIQTFESFSLNYYMQNAANLEHMKQVLSFMKQYAARFTPGESGNVVMFGGTGLGKTHLSSAAAGVVIGRGFGVYYTAAVGMIGDFEHERFGNTTAGASRAGTDRYYECDLLIIDDVGTEVTNQFTQSVMYDVINTRLNRKQSTIISTNLLPEEFRSRYSDRLTSRILGEYNVLTFVGTDVRQQKLRRQS